MGSDDSAKGPLAWWSAIFLNEHNVVDAKTSFASPPLIGSLKGIEIFG